MTAIVDPAADAAAALARMHRGAAVAGTLEDVLDACDAVHVCTPVGSHTALASTALDAGRHVLVEKPLAATLEETDALIERAEAARSVLAAVHQFPFQRGVAAILDRRETLGALVRTELTIASAGADGREGPARRRVLLEILPHAVSLLARLVPDFDDRALGIATSTDDDLHLHGRVGEVDLAITLSLRARPTRNELTVLGTRGSACADLFHGYAVFERGTVSRRDKMLRPLRVSADRLFSAGTNLLGRALRSEPAYPGLRALLEAFYAACRDGSVSPTPAAELRSAARLLDRVAAEG